MNRTPTACIAWATFVICASTALADPATDNATNTATPPSPPASAPATPPPATTTPETPPADPDLRPLPEGPLYPEEGAGETTLWLDLGGVGYWLTERAPLADLTPLSFGIGLAHQMGPARLAWRAHLYQTLPGDDRPANYLYVDFLSIEYVFSESALRPWLRGGVGFGLDLEDSGEEIDGRDPSLGDDGYFNDDNGATGGFGLTLGAGLDAYVSEMWFVRIDAVVRAQGGAGRGGVMTGSHAGVGVKF